MGYCCLYRLCILSSDTGLINSLIKSLGGQPVSWYAEPMAWPFILTFVHIWKGIGYSAIIYLATIIGIDKTLYESAMVDGATKWQQIKSITLPFKTYSDHDDHYEYWTYVLFGFWAFLSGTYECRGALQYDTDHRYLCLSGTDAA